MPDPLLSLDHDQVKVAPGSQASIKVTVRSTSTRVEGFRLQVIGSPPNRWSQVNPPEVDVYPGEETTATVIFSPPTGTQTLSGTFPFGVRAQATESADDSAVVEGDVNVGEVDGLQSKLIPVTASSRGRGRHVLHLRNQGNTDVEYHLEATDPDDLLSITLNPARVDLRVGEEQSVRLTVRPRKPLLLGAPARMPFQVFGEPLVTPVAEPDNPYGAPGRLSIDGALIQRPLFTVPLLIILTVLALIVAACIVWVRLNPVDKTVQLANIANTVAPPPTGVTAKAVASNKIRVTWQPLQQITSYVIWSTPKGTRAPVQSALWSQTAADVVSHATRDGLRSLAPHTQYCFRVQGVRYGNPGVLSAQVCATTASPIVNTPTPTPVTSYRYWLVAYDRPKVPAASAAPSQNPTATTASSPTAAEPASTPSSPSATPTGDDQKSLEWATRRVDRLVLARFTNAQIIDTQTYPKMEVLGTRHVGDTTWDPVTDPMWLVAVGQYPDMDGTITTDCFRLRDYYELHDSPLSSGACMLARVPDDG